VQQPLEVVIVPALAEAGTVVIPEHLLDPVEQPR
jgi:hypothetical protein